ncbi:MAG: hypothetical protein M1299_02615 [Firmicutes bacterium]|nr:hypothetical protein [Bacillota bacterium]MCL5038717.1 hypothetical protein [Bacillota bacterium]
MLKEQGVLVRVDLDNGILQLSEGILFPSGSAQLTPQGERVLRILANVLMDVLPCYAGAPGGDPLPQCKGNDHRGKLETLLIEGHTDDVPISNPVFPDNWSLSTARAIRTYQDLAGVEPNLRTLQ